VDALPIAQQIDIKRRARLLLQTAHAQIIARKPLALLACGGRN
jgi:hypothetical protein